MRIGITGSTGHTNYVLDGVQGRPDAEICGVAPGSDGEDVSGLYDDVRALSPTAARYDEYTRLLDDAGPDVVAVAPYFGDIAAVSIAALDRDIHVFAEKPLATTDDDLAALRAAYRDSGGELAAMFGSRYEPQFLAAHRRVREGAVGEIRLLDARKSYKLGRREEPYRDRETYGGTIPWVGSHAVDWINWVTEGSFESVTASHSRRANRDHGDLEATAAAQFELTDEVFASVCIDYLRPEGAPTHGDDRLRIVGTDGTIQVERGRTYLLDDGDGRRELPLGGGRNVFEEFLAHVRGEESLPVTAEESLAATDAVLRARRSADEERPVAFED